MTYIAVRKEAFGRARGKAKGVTSGTSLYDSVRRPFVGIQSKRNTYALIKVITEDGVEIPLMGTGNAKNGRSRPYSNFFIQRLDRSEAEKAQVVQTFGEAFVHFHGGNPLALNITGLLINSVDFDWHREWWFNYEHYLRGTKLVENKARVYLFVEEDIFEGYVMNSQASRDATEPNLCPFSTTLLVTNHIPVRMIGSSSSGIVQPDPRMRTTLGEPIAGDSSNFPYHDLEHVGTADDFPFHDEGQTLDEAMHEDDVAALDEAYREDTLRNIFTDDDEVISEAVSKDTGFTKVS